MLHQKRQISDDMFTLLETDFFQLAIGRRKKKITRNKLQNAERKFKNHIEHDRLEMGRELSTNGTTKKIIKHVQ